MAVAFRAAASNSSGSVSGSTTASCTVPSAAVAGDLAVAFVVQNGTQAISNVPSGWSQVAQATNSTTTRITAYTFVVAAGDINASRSLTFAAGQRWVMGYSVYSGATSVVIVNTGNNNTATTSPAFNTVTPTANNAMIVELAGWYNSTNGNTWTGTASTNYTERVDLCTTYASLPNVAGYVEDRLLSGGGGSSTGAGTGTTTQSVTRANVVLAILPVTTVAVGTATESDDPQTVAGKKLLAIGTATATGTALPIAGVKRRLLGTATETGTPLPLAGRKLRAIGTAGESDAGTSAVPSHRASLGTTTETDAARPITGRKLLAIGTAGEADTSYGYDALHRAWLGTATELDAALPITHVRAPIAVGRAAESDLALGIKAIKRRALGTALEGDLPPVAVGHYRTRGVLRAAELDTALPILGVKRRAIGTALEVSSQPTQVRGVKRAWLGTATEHDSLGVVRRAGDLTVRAGLVARRLAARMAGRHYNAGDPERLVSTGPPRR